MAHPRSRIVALVIGCLLLLPAVGLLAAGAGLGIVASTQRDADGYFEVTLDPVTTPTVAVTARDLSFAAEPGSPDWVVDWFDADVRLRVSGIDPDTATFVGIARTADVDRYLTGSAHTRVVELTAGTRPVYDDQPGDAEIAAPTTQNFWVADAVGTDTLQLDWAATAGRWSVVVMNADGSPGVAADVDVGLRAGFLVPLIIGLLAFGVVLTALAVVLVVVGASRQGGPPGGSVSETGGGTPTSGGALPPPAAPTPHEEVLTGASSTTIEHRSHPVQLTATLDPQLSRWMWLVKWFLAIPHLVIVALVVGTAVRWLAADGSRVTFDPTGGGGLLGVLVFVAGLMLLFTGRSPQALFDLVIGLNRWIYRVIAYAALMTDDYPPLRLDQGGAEPGPVRPSSPNPTAPDTPAATDVHEPRPSSELQEVH